MDIENNNKINNVGLNIQRFQLESPPNITTPMAHLHSVFEALNLEHWTVKGGNTQFNILRSIQLNLANCDNWTTCYVVITIIWIVLENTLRNGSSLQYSSYSCTKYDDLISVSRKLSVVY